MTPADKMDRAEPNSQTTAGAPQQTSFWWRFSLRELLLVTTIVALVLTLIRVTAREPFEPSPVYASFDLKSMIELTAKQLGSRVGVGGGASERAGAVEAVKDGHYQVHVRAGSFTASDFVKAIAAETDRRVAEAKCAVFSQGESRSGSELLAFHRAYEHGDTRGQLWVRAIDTEDNEFVISAYLVEYQRR